MQLRNKIYLGVIGVLSLFGFLGHISSSHGQITTIPTTAPTIATVAPTQKPLPTPTNTPTPIPTTIPTIPVYNYVAPTAIPAATTENSSSGQSTQPVVNSQQSCAGETALCNDGTCSDAAHHQGACSYHGGVAQFYR